MKIIHNYTEYQYNIHNAVVTATSEPAPYPWEPTLESNVSSVLAAGFSDDFKYLICTDGCIRWLYDLETGECLNDLTEKSFGELYEHNTLSITGFGPLENQKICSSGIFGSTAWLHTATEDGWKVIDFCSTFFQHHIVLTSPDQKLFCKMPTFTLLRNIFSTLICYGFVDNGKKLLIVEREKIIVYSRP